MRTLIAILVLGLGLAACSKGENAGAEEAKKQADQELQDKLKEPNAVPKKIDPPVAAPAPVVPAYADFAGPHLRAILPPPATGPPSV